MKNIRAITRFKARRHAIKVMQALNEVKEIETVRKKAKSFDDFLKEF